MLEIREGRKEDIPELLRLIRALALYERAPEKVINTEEQLLKDGFGEHAYYRFFMAEFEGQCVGFSLHYYRYSTWRGRVLYLEDLFVEEEHRGKNIGFQLLKKIVETAQNENCKQVTWQVLDWNKIAIDFYKSLGADFDKSWVNVSLSEEHYTTFISH